MRAIFAHPRTALRHAARNRQIGIDGILRQTYFGTIVFLPYLNIPATRAEIKMAAATEKKIISGEYKILPAAELAALMGN